MISVSDRISIEDAVHRYARGVDRKDWDLVRSAYHADAIDNHGSYNGPLDGFISSLEERHRTIDQSIHLVSNILIETFSSESALVESYFCCFQTRRDGDGGLVQTQAIGRYIDRFERRDGLWRIARRNVAFDRYHVTDAGTDRLPTMDVGRSRRDDDDILHQERRALRSGAFHRP